MPKVTIYDNIKKTDNGDDLDLSDIMEGIKDGQWQDEVANVRAELIKKKRAKLKENLKYFTGSGTFDQRSNDGLRQHSGRIVMDFDDVEDIDEARSLLAPDPYTEYMFLSASSTGLAVVVKINPNLHAESFLALEKYYLDKHQLKVDKHCKEVSRPRYISYDPDLHYNPEAKQFDLEQDNKQVFKDKVSGIMMGAVDGQNTHITLLKAARLMGGFVAGGLVNETEAIDILTQEVGRRRGSDHPDRAEDLRTIKDGVEYGKRDPLSRADIGPQFTQLAADDDSIKQIYAWAHQTNRAGRQWSDEDIHHLHERLGTLEWGAIKAILIEIYENHKDEFGIEDKPDIYKVEHFLNKRWVFAKNVVTQSREFRPKKSKKLEPLNIDTIYRKMQYARFKYSLEKLKSIFRSEFVPEYDPFQDYFKSLSAWDKKTDHISELANYVTMENQEFFTQQFKKALVRCIACSLDYVENRIVFVLVGEKQATGKSTFIRFLNPFGDKYYTESPIRDNKDGEFSFAENFIYNLEELSSLSNTDVNRLKAIISKTSIKERKAYAVDVEQHPRRCNFWASTNRLEFLTDTENTRWLCFNILKIDWDYKKKVDINKVWAQAYQLYKDGFDHNLTQDEQSIRDSSNKNYEICDLEKELVMKSFTIAKRGEANAKFYPTSDILSVLISQVDQGVTIHSRFLGKIMTQLGFVRDKKKYNGHTVRGFWAKPNIDNKPTIEGESTEPIF